MEILQKYTIGKKDCVNLLWDQLCFGKDDKFKTFSKYYDEYRSKTYNSGIKFKFQREIFEKFVKEVIDVMFQCCDNSFLEIVYKILDDSDVTEEEGIEYILLCYISSNFKTFSKIDRINKFWGFNEFIRFHKCKFSNELFPSNGERDERFVTTLLNSYVDFITGFLPGSKEDVQLVFIRYLLFFRDERETSYIFNPNYEHLKNIYKNVFSDDKEDIYNVKELFFSFQHYDID